MFWLGGCLALGLSGGVAPQIKGDFVPGQSIVRLTPAAYRSLGTSSTFAGHQILGRINALGALLVKAEPGRIPKLAGIRSVERNAYAEVCFTPNDPMFNQQWYLTKINAPVAWDLGRGSVNTPIAIVDSGIVYTHEDIAPVYQTGGWDFVNNDNDPMDDFGHGTLVAGVASAATNNAVGVSGLGFGCPLIAIKVVNAGGGATVFNMAQGISYAVTDTNARVINVSLASGLFNQTLDDACDLALDAGVVVVAAAGNNNSTNVFYPAAKPGVIGVAATDQNDLKWGQSNYGSGWVDVAAPGDGILSTNLNPTYGAISGTSMSAPMVAGLAGLLYNQMGVGRSQASAEIVRSSIYAGCNDAIGWTTFGRIDARDSLRFAKSVNPASFVYAPYSSDVGGGIVTTRDSSGNVYMAHAQGSGNAANIRVSKYNSFGAVVWQRSLDGSGFKDIPAEMVTDANGNLFIGATAYTADGTSDFLIGKYSPAGALLWKKTLDGPGQKTDKARALSLGASHLVLGGQSYQSDNSTRMAFFWAVNPADGTSIATKAYNHTASFGDDVWDISARSDGRFYAALASPTPTQQNNAVVVLFNPAASTVTVMGAYNGPSNNDDYAVSVKTASNGDAFVGGFSEDKTAFVLRVRSTGGFAFARRTNGQLWDMILDTTGAPIWTGSLELAPGNRAYVTKKIDPDTGNVVWARRIGGFGKTIDQVYDATSVSIVQNGGSVIVTGYTSSKTFFNTMTLWFNASSGQLLRVARYDAGGAEDIGVSVVTSSVSKSIFVACLTKQAAGSQARLLRYAP